MTVNDKMGAKEWPLAGIITDDGNSETFNTGEWRNKKPLHLEDKCKHCMLCVPYCPEGCIYQDNGILKEIDLDYCKGCGICAKVCPFKAIEMKDINEKEEI